MDDEKNFDHDWNDKTILDIESEPWYENIKGLLDEADSQQLISWGLYSSVEERDDVTT
jgi:hypothetical protein